MTTATVQSADGDLLRLYARENNQDAFTRIVRRHVDWVYSAALRITREACLAEDVTQGVFLALAQKSDRLANHPNIAGWLFQATQFGAVRAALKRERRRRHIEAQAMQTLKQPIEADGTWDDISGRLEEAVGRLAARDRDAIILRFYQQLSYGELAAQLRIPEDAARMRVRRAIDRLRDRLRAKEPAGAEAFAGILAAHAVAPAPTSLAASITGVTHAPAAIAVSKTVKLAMSLAKLKFVAAISLVALAPITTAAVIYQSHHTPTAPPPALVQTLAPADPVATSSTTSAPARKVYTGWVHTVRSDPQTNAVKSEEYSNLDQGVFALMNVSNQNTKYMVFDDYAAGNVYVYREQGNAIRIALIKPPPKGAERPTPANSFYTNYFSDLLRQIQAVASPSAVTITNKVEGGLERFDIKVADTAAESTRIRFHGTPDATPPTSVWVDPKTGLIMQAIFQNQKETFTYGQGISSIYDVGAPRDAKVLDDRPNAQTIAFHDRVWNRRLTPFPDGVTILWTTPSTSTDSSLQVFEQRGDSWRARVYTSLAEKRFDMPGDWQNAGSDAFFLRLAQILPDDELISDGKTVREHDIDQLTGKPTHTESHVVTGPDGKQQSVSEVVQGDEVAAGQKLHGVSSDYSPLILSYPAYAERGRWVPGFHLELVTSPDRPGLVALRTQGFGSTAQTVESVAESDEEWMDPAHSDRMVESLQTRYDLAAHAIKTRTLSQFSDYATLPDGRSYPTLITVKTGDANDGQMEMKDVEKKIFHFFPGRTLPALPAKNMP